MTWVATVPADMAVAPASIPEDIGEAARAVADEAGAGYGYAPVESFVVAAAKPSRADAMIDVEKYIVGIWIGRMSERIIN
jgi:hypothetical protein